ncbi:hypothetical protein NDU88_003232 [Pleurodeles waltl]|uniref:Uncharacterized protein n=1 Tax=Pleurodeles waltl TaxID=8319 RepID=A0AAV7WQX9_PLEWA|nr:hypothetical protein NDU88_003232 [Pleurodeles waltl]
MLTMSRSKELSRVQAAHMESALMKSIKVEPVNAVMGGQEQNGETRANRQVGVVPVICVEEHTRTKGNVQRQGSNAPTVNALNILPRFAAQPRSQSRLDQRQHMPHKPFNNRKIHRTWMTMKNRRGQYMSYIPLNQATYSGKGFRSVE